MTIDVILEDGEHIKDYLISRNILAQYKKAKQMLCDWMYQKFDFKVHQPKNKGIYKFRINQKYRAFGYFREDIGNKTFVVTKISDHQDF